MKPEDIASFEQYLAVLKHVNKQLGTTFDIEQMRGSDFTYMRLYNRNGTVFIADLATMGKVCVGMLAVVKELGKEE